MFSNFKIVTRRSKGSIHIDLIGEFDGFSALKLIEVLKANCEKVKNIFIDTSNLFLIHPLALDIFQKEYTLNNTFNDLLFIGKHGNTMQPEKNESFWY